MSNLRVRVVQPNTVVYQSTKRIGKGNIDIYLGLDKIKSEQKLTVGAKLDGEWMPMKLRQRRRWWDELSQPKKRHDPQPQPKTFRSIPQNPEYWTRLSQRPAKRVPEPPDVVHPKRGRAPRQQLPRPWWQRLSNLSWVQAEALRKGFSELQQQQKHVQHSDTDEIQSSIIDDNMSYTGVTSQSEDMNIKLGQYKHEDDFLETDEELSSQIRDETIPVIMPSPVNRHISSPDDDTTTEVRKRISELIRFYDSKGVMGNNNYSSKLKDVKSHDVELNKQISAEEKDNIATNSVTSDKNDDANSISSDVEHYSDDADSLSISDLESLNLGSDITLGSDMELLNDIGFDTAINDKDLLMSDDDGNEEINNEQSNENNSTSAHQSKNSPSLTMSESNLVRKKSGNLQSITEQNQSSDSENFKTKEVEDINHSPLQSTLESEERLAETDAYTSDTPRSDVTPQDSRKSSLKQRLSSVFRKKSK